MEKSYLVYNKERDILNLNDEEHKLIGELMESPPIKYNKIIRKYFEVVTDKQIAFKRLDEILTFYYNSQTPTLAITPFTGRKNLVEMIFKILEDVETESNSLVSKRKHTNLSLDKLIDISKYIPLRALLVQNEILTEVDFNFIPKGKGIKSMAAALILVLERKGYFNRVINIDEVPTILKNSFGIEITSRQVGSVYKNLEKWSPAYNFIKKIA